MIVNKKKFLLGAALVLSSATILASCDDFYALPNNYGDAIVNNEDGAKTDVYNNIFSEIYDAIALGKTDKILDEFMYVIAKDQFGTYAEHQTLHASGTVAQKAEFARNHASMFVKSNDQYILENSGAAFTEDDLLAARVDDFYNRISDRITEYFYNEISGGTYSERGIFYEERLARSYFTNLYDIDLDKADYEGYLPPETEFNKYDVSAVIDLSVYQDYIDRTLVPDYYRELLVEEFLYSDNYSALGRAYARNVDIVHLTSSTTYTQDGDDLNLAAYNLLKAYANEYIIGETPATDIDFEIVANAWRGFRGINADGSIIELTEAETDLLEAAGFTREDTDRIEIGNQSIQYYPITQFGILADQYALLDEYKGTWEDRFVSSEASAAYSSFTNSNTYPAEVGLMIQISTLASQDYTIDGWYVKTSGITDLPEAISTRLFNISVSTELDNFDEDEMENPTNGYGNDNVNYDSDNYVRYINNNYYLTPSLSQSTSIDPTNFVIYEGGSTYIVKVNEAVSTSKLNIQSENGYFSLRAHNTADSALFTEDTAFEVAHVLGTRDSYVNSAYESYIEQYSVDYHDSAVFSYFETQFPDLFDDD